MLSNIMDVIANSPYFAQDKESFESAKEDYYRYSNKLRILTDPKQRKNRSLIYYHNGLYICKVIGVLIFIFVVSMAAV